MKVWLPAIRGYSGSDVFTERLALALQKRGVAAEITWFPTHYQWAPQFLSRRNAPSGTTLIHANAWHGLAFSRRAPLILTEHQGVFGRDHRPYRSLAQEFVHTQVMRRYLSRSLARATRVTAVSACSASGLGRLGFADARVVPNFVDTARFTPASAPMRRAPFRLLFVGNFVPLKGAEVLRELMPRLGASFELCFTAGLRSVRTGYIADNMRCLGRIGDDETLIDAYRSCDAVIAPSYFEGFGYTALEGMACGKPVIASRAGALPEVVVDGVSGILCPPGRVEAFAEACRHLATNPAVCHAMGQAGRAVAVERFSEEAVIPQYLEIYDEAALCAR
ncbi:MAG: glycosyltransferase family 4 protein [Acidiferrobacteraceae bacterium]